MSVANTESSMTLSQSMDSVNTVAEEEWLLKAAGGARGCVAAKVSTLTSVLGARQLRHSGNGSSGSSRPLIPRRVAREDNRSVTRGRNMVVLSLLSRDHKVLKRTGTKMDGSGCPCCQATGDERGKNGR
ncbi:hypothetical protein HPB50_012623 [Hyalomma asiaticum]|uniref:Uncharacterized protein n=1 Tax=Hyalomma asiaticum TaxID=266040 RepID=A0ACB7S9H3_HYAAI|nr:hypothetical protein HPB50_012623 [Hyalomma asiaticum]